MRRCPSMSDARLRGSAIEARVRPSCRRPGRSHGNRHRISKSEVSRICIGLDERVAAFRNRTLGHVAFPYIEARAVGVISRGLARLTWPLARLGRCTQERWNRDPAKRPRPPLHHHPPRGDAHGLRPSAPGFVGCRVRRARSAPLRVSAALGPAAPSGDRADSGMGARRDQDVSVPRGGWPCHGCGKRVERSRSARRICCRPGGGGGACRRTRARCCGLRHQGRACGGPRMRG